MDYPGKAQDEHRREIGEGIFGYLREQGVVDERIQPQESTGPSAIDNLRAAARAQRAAVAHRLFGAYATAYGAEIPVDQEPEEAAEEDR